MWTVIIVVLIIAITCWIKRREWFSKNTQILSTSKKSLPPNPQPQPQPGTTSQTASTPAPAPKKKWGGWKIVEIVVLTLFFAGIFIGALYFGSKIVKSIFYPETPAVTVEFPTSGDGIATMDKPLKARLNPRRSTIQVTGAGHMKFVLTSNPSKFWYCDDKKPEGSIAKTGKKEDWDCLPDADYFIYPNGCEKVCLSWWQ
jgi:hypothetical protein